MLFKLIVFCIVIEFELQSTNSMNVNCAYDNQWKSSGKKLCKIEKLEYFEPGDQLNLVNLRSSDRITEFRLINVPAMTSFPNEIFDQVPSLENVTIENVNIEMITKYSFYKSRMKLEYLRIKGSKVKSIPSDLLFFLSNLEILDLSGNKIATIEDGAFMSSNLKEVYLQGNRLKIINRGVFYKASKLRAVNLSDNLIEEIEDGTFDLLKIEELYLNKNHLKTLPPNLFANTPMLRWLELQSNQLTNILALERAQHLQYLFLKDNPTLKTQSFSSLVHLPKLKYLSLKNTGLTLDKAVTPLQSTELIHLIISQNNLSDPHLLQHLRGINKLEFIGLNNNDLRRLDDFDNIKVYFPRLKIILLHGNHLNCDWMTSAMEVCEETEIRCRGILYDCVEESTVGVKQDIEQSAVAVKPYKINHSTTIFDDVGQTESSRIEQSTAGVEQTEKAYTAINPKSIAAKIKATELVSSVLILFCIFYV